MYGIFDRIITTYTVIFGVYIRFWPALTMCNVHCRLLCHALFPIRSPKLQPLSIGFLLKWCITTLHRSFPIQFRKTVQTKHHNPSQILSHPVQKNRSDVSHTVQENRSDAASQSYTDPFPYCSEKPSRRCITILHRSIPILFRKAFRRCITILHRSIPILFRKTVQTNRSVALFRSTVQQHRSAELFKNVSEFPPCCCTSQCLSIFFSSQCQRLCASVHSAGHARLALKLAQANSLKAPHRPFRIQWYTLCTVQVLHDWHPKVSSCKFTQSSSSILPARNGARFL